MFAVMNRPLPSGSISTYVATNSTSRGHLISTTNFEWSLLGGIDAGRSDEILVGKLVTRSANFCAYKPHNHVLTPDLTCYNFQNFAEIDVQHFPQHVVQNSSKIDE